MVKNLKHTTNSNSYSCLLTEILIDFTLKRKFILGLEITQGLKKASCENSFLTENSIG